MTDIDLKAEIAKVQAEILGFRQDILPVLLAEQSEAVALSRWQRAMVELADLLPLGPMALMPHYLFAVLFEKVSTLRQLAQGN